MLKVGDNIPNINVTTHKGETINLANFKGKKVILFFYPRANTPGCTAQSCNLNDNYSKLTSQGYEVIGVSPDTVDKQNKFADKFGFKYNLLADDSRVLRTTFIIDENGVIERVIDKVNTKGHSDQILD
jgi:peroxiredoxin Q/BCP